MSSNLTVRQANPNDMSDIAALQARVFGPGRFTRSAYRVREGAPKLSQHCHVGYLDQQLIGALNFTEITIGESKHAVLLGPFVVDPKEAQKGVGALLMEQALLEMQSAGVRLVVLIGDEPYYSRFGFSKVPSGQITFPGPVDPNRILALEQSPDALKSFHGLVHAQTES